MVDLLIHILFVFRLSYMLAEEAGPWNIFGKLRANTIKNQFLPFQCLFCTSVWVGIGTSLCLQKGIGYGLVLSAGTIIIFAFINKLID